MGWFRLDKEPAASAVSPSAHLWGTIVRQSHYLNRFGGRVPSMPERQIYRAARLPGVRLTERAIGQFAASSFFDAISARNRQLTVPCRDGDTLGVT